MGIGEAKDTITVDRDEWDRLNEVNDFMNALEAAGVDSWDGYGDAQDILEEWQEES